MHRSLLNTYPQFGIHHDLVLFTITPETLGSHTHDDLFLLFLLLWF